MPGQMLRRDPVDSPEVYVMAKLPPSPNDKAQWRAAALGRPSTAAPGSASAPPPGAVTGAVSPASRCRRPRPDRIPRPAAGGRPPRRAAPPCPATRLQRPTHRQPRPASRAAVATKETPPTLTARGTWPRSARKSVPSATPATTAQANPARPSPSRPDRRVGSGRGGTGKNIGTPPQSRLNAAVRPSSAAAGAE